MVFDLQGLPETLRTYTPMFARVMVQTIADVRQEDRSWTNDVSWLTDWGVYLKTKPDKL